MDYFHYHQQQLFAEHVPLTMLANRFGTPCYVYSKKTIERHYLAFKDALGTHPSLICYAVKANSSLAILQLLAHLGSGFDVVSKGELQRVLAAGGDPQKSVFSGVAKSEEEICFALKNNIHCINVESEAELERIQALCQHHQWLAPISLRINPDIDAKTHPYISTGMRDNKFGIEFNKAKQLYLNHKAYPNLRFIGIDCHIGSQLTDLTPFLEALEKLIELADLLSSHGLAIDHLDLGGGLGVTYRNESPPLPAELALHVKKKLATRSYKIILEPGRAIMANAGILLTTVEYIKEHHQTHYAITDAAMTELLRPALYQAWHDIIPVEIQPTLDPQWYDIVGGVCESSDFLGKHRQLAIGPGSLLAVRGAGAYGASMGSNYNSRPKPPEILVDGERVHLIRKRETFDELIRNELLL